MPKSKTKPQYFQHRGHAHLRPPTSSETQVMMGSEIRTVDVDEGDYEHDVSANSFTKLRQFHSARATFTSKGRPGLSSPFPSSDSEVLSHPSACLYRGFLRTTNQIPMTYPKKIPGRDPGHCSPSDL